MPSHDASPWRERSLVLAALFALLIAGLVLYVLFWGNQPGDRLVGLAVLAASLLGVVGYVVADVLSRSKEIRRWRLVRLERQLTRFYGPFAQLTKQNAAIYHPDPHSSRRMVPKDLTTDAEKQVWQIWMRFVLMPTNERIERLLREHGHLCVPIDSYNPTDDVQRLYRHNAYYRQLIARWRSGDNTVLANDGNANPERDYPDRLDAYAQALYRQCVNDQNAILQDLGMRRIDQRAGVGFAIPGDGPAQDAPH